MKLRTLTASAFGLMLATSALATALQSSGVQRAAPVEGTIVSLSWVPNWLNDAIKRAVDDATDPRDRRPKANG